MAWVVDDTGFAKDGSGSPGVARQAQQYSGTLGKVANCQIGVAKLAGTERVTEGGADYDTDNRLKRQGVARRQHAFKVNPQTLRTLGMGEFVVISAGCYAKVAAALPRQSFGLPELPAVKDVTEAIVSARVAAALPNGHAEDTTETVGDVPATRGPVRF